MNNVANKRKPKMRETMLEKVKERDNVYAGIRRPRDCTSDAERR